MSTMNRTRPGTTRPAAVPPLDIKAYHPSVDRIRDEHVSDWSAEFVNARQGGRQDRAPASERRICYGETVMSIPVRSSSIQMYVPPTGYSPLASMPSSLRMKAKIRM